MPLRKAVLNEEFRFAVIRFTLNCMRKGERRGDISSQCIRDFSKYNTFVALVQRSFVSFCEYFETANSSFEIFAKTV